MFTFLTEPSMLIIIKNNLIYLTNKKGLTEP